MDTYLEEDEKLLKSVETAWEHHLSTNASLLAKFESFSQDIRDTMEDVKPKLPIPASKQQCLMKVKEVLAGFDRNSESRRFVKSWLVQALQGQYDLISDFGAKCNLDLVFKAEYEVSVQIAHIGGDTIKHKHQLSAKIREITELCDETVAVYEQSCLQDMIEGQEDDFKQWFDEEVLGWYGEHVNMVRHRNAGVQLDPTVVSGPPHLPLEIISLVFSFSDLETCVALREVSSQWYSVFYHIQGLWKSKMKQRNPWMAPEGDLQTWQDVVLVFVKRLQNGVWKKSKNLDTVELKGNDTPPEIVVGKELKFGEKLPSSFVSLTDSSACQARVCEHVHVVSSDNREFLMDPWTGESRAYPDEFEVVSRGSEDTIIRVKNMEITVPTLLFAQNPFSVRFYRSTVLCDIQDGATLLVMPRENPHHVNGFTFRHPFSKFEIGDVFVVEANAGDYYLVDFADKRLTRYHLAALCGFPVAFYHGLIWLQHSYKECLVPTFLDLQSPEQLYYRPDRAIVGTSFKNERCVQGSNQRHSDRFLVGTSTSTSTAKSGLDLVDLVEGTVTRVRPHLAHPDFAEVFVGFNRGKFQARYMQAGVGIRTRERILSENDVDEDPWFGGENQENE